MFSTNISKKGCAGIKAESYGYLYKTENLPKIGVANGKIRDSSRRRDPS